MSKPLGQLETLLPDGQRNSAGKRKLLEAKDCFVRTALDMSEPVESILPPHQQRVVAEKVDLHLRWNALDAFIESNGAFKHVPAAEQARLKRQLDMMHELSSMLGERIANF